MNVKCGWHRGNPVMAIAQIKYQWKNEMPKLQRTDTSPENGWLPPPTRVCQWPQVYNNRVRPNWPFLVTYEGGQTYLNKAKQTRRADELDALGEALL